MSHQNWYKNIPILVKTGVWRDLPRALGATYSAGMGALLKKIALRMSKNLVPPLIAAVLYALFRLGLLPGIACFGLMALLMFSPKFWRWLES